MNATISVEHAHCFCRPNTDGSLTCCGCSLSQPETPFAFMSLTTTATAHTAHCFCQVLTNGQRKCCGCSLIDYSWP